MMIPLARAAPEIVSTHISRRIELPGLSASPITLAISILAAVLALTLLLQIYRREAAAQRPRLKWLCATLRIVLWAVLMLLLLNPVRVVDVQRTAQGTCVVLLDRSLSMTAADRKLPQPIAETWSAALNRPVDEVRRLSRVRLSRQLLHESLLPILRRNNRVLVLPFDDLPRTPVELPRLPAEAESRPAPIEPSGTATDLTAAVSTALQAAPENLLPAIVLITDGRTNAPETRLQSVERLARRAGERGVPIHVIPVGDPTPPRNLLVQNVLVNEQVMKGNRLGFTTVISQRGCSGETATIRLYEIKGTGAQATRQLITEQRVELDDRLVRARFDTKPSEVGDHVYLIEVEELADEQNAEDNALRRHVTVIDDRMQVLLISGYPSFEFRFIKALLQRTPGIEVAVWLQSQDPRVPQGGRKPLKELPVSRDALIQYDLLLMIDPDPEPLGDEWTDTVEKLLSDRGTGLVWIAGRRHTRRLFTNDVPAARLLPLRADTERATMTAGRILTTVWSLALTDQGRSTPMTQLSVSAPAEAATRDASTFWSRLPGLYWSFPIKEIRPGALVLLRYTDPKLHTLADRACPFLLYQLYGRGRLLFVGSDQTWRWRSAGVHIYEEFWLRTCRFAVQGRLLGRRKRAELLTTQRQFDFGQPVPVALQLYDKEFQPWEPPEISLRVRKGGTTVETLTVPSSGRGTGLFETLFYPPGPGEFQITWRGEEDRQVSYNFSVKAPAGEMENVQRNDPLLRAVAAQSGGRIITPDQVEGLRELIHPRTVRHVESLPPEPVWDRTGLLLVLLLVLTAEWTLRKWLGLL